MPKTLNRPPSGICTAGNTAGSTGNETKTSQVYVPNAVEPLPASGTLSTVGPTQTSQIYVPNAVEPLPAAGTLGTVGVSSTQTDNLDEGSIRQDQLGYAGS